MEFLVIGGLVALFVGLAGRRLRRKASAGEPVGLAAAYPVSVIEHRDPENGRRDQGGF